MALPKGLLCVPTNCHTLGDTWGSSPPFFLFYQAQYGKVTEGSQFGSDLNLCLDGSTHYSLGRWLYMSSIVSQSLSFPLWKMGPCYKLCRIMVDYIVKYSVETLFGTEILQMRNDVFLNMWKITQRKTLKYLFFICMPYNY